MIDIATDEELQQMLEAQRYCPIMEHNHFELLKALHLFSNYLTKDELCERQYTGRFWTIKTYGQSHSVLYILIDNKTFIKIDNLCDGTFSETICDTNIIRMLLPNELRGCYYN